MSGIHSLTEALEWAATNGTTFEITKNGESFSIRASNGRITAEYIVDLADASGLTGAIWAALSSVEAGTEYHRVHGYTPGLNLGEEPYRT